MLGAALRQMNRILVGGTVTGFSDGQLLERFVSRRDATAFEALVARHGPMVLSVCSSVLHDPNDAEDAFQATFLILVKKAGTIRGNVALGGWLYLVAHRVAIRANAAAVRRRAHERRAGEMAAARSAIDPDARNMEARTLHEEIVRLPEKLRLAVVLCDLQGVPQERAAGELQLSQRTLRRRLSEGRERLRARLNRRGLARDEGMLGAALLRESLTPLPPSLGQSTIRAALATVDHTLPAGAVSAAATRLTHEVLRMMLFRQIKLIAATLLGAGLLAWGASAAFVPLADDAQSKAVTSSRPPAQQRAGTAAPHTGRPSDDAAGKRPVHGRVIDPDGNPVENAQVYIRHFKEIGWTPFDPATVKQKGRVGSSDATGQFEFMLDTNASDWSHGEVAPWHKAQIAAAAPGFAPGWIDAGSLANGGDATLRLVRDDVPIRGRVLDSQGRPVAGATVRLRQIGIVKEGVNPDTMLAAGEVADEATSSWYGHADKAPSWYGPNDLPWPGGQNAWTTAADGRFEVKGIGRDRIARLDIQSPHLADGTIDVMARPSNSPTKPRPRPNNVPPEFMFHGAPPKPRLVGATFDYITGPLKPVTGVVRLKGTNQPLAGVNVRGKDSGTMTKVVALTDANGRFQLDGLPKSEAYQVCVDPRPGVDPFLRSWTTITDTEGLKPIDMTIDVAKGVLIIGQIVDAENGKPVIPGDVQYAKLPTNQSKDEATLGHRNLPDSRFGMTVPPGRAMIVASVRGKDLPYTRARLSKADKGKGVGGFEDGETTMILLNSYHTYAIVDVPADAESLTVNLKVTRGLTRKGRILDWAGKPVTGAQCYGLSATLGSVVTLTDESFEVLGLEADYPRQVVFAHKRRGLVGSVILERDDLKNDAPLEVKLRPAGTVKGRLIDVDGSPLVAAKISLISLGADGFGLPLDELWPDDTVHISDAHGRFEIVGLKPGVKTSLVVDAKVRPNYRLEWSGALRNITIQRPGEVVDLGDVKVVEVPTPYRPERACPSRPDTRLAASFRRISMGHHHQAPAVPDPWAPYEPDRTAPWGWRRVAHLHRRAGFAATWDELERDMGDGHEASITRMLEGKSRTRGVPQDFAEIASRLVDEALAAPVSYRLRGWWIFRMLSGPDPLAERLTLMWHNHFATSNLKVNDFVLMYRQNETFRRLCRAPFGKLLHAMLRDPALLIWLDAFDNTRGHGNENLGRELMELFTLGIGPYSEDDVKQSARALTGWKLVGEEARLIPSRHDPGPKTILGRTAAFDADSLAECLLDHPATSRRLARRLCDEFLGPGNTDPVAVDELAEQFRGHNLDIGWCVATILRSRVFFADKTIGQRVSSPVEFVVGSARALEVLDPPPSTPVLADWCGRLGQELFCPPNVNGWPGGRSWITTRSAIGRANFATALVEGEPVGLLCPLDLPGLAARHGQERNPFFFPRLLLPHDDAPAIPTGDGASARRSVAAILASPAGQRC